MKATTKWLADQYGVQSRDTYDALEELVLGVGLPARSALDRHLVVLDALRARLHRVRDFRRNCAYTQETHCRVSTPLWCQYHAAALCYSVLSI